MTATIPTGQAILDDQRRHNTCVDCGLYSRQRVRMERSRGQYAPLCWDCHGKRVREDRD